MFIRASNLSNEDMKIWLKNSADIKDTCWLWKKSLNLDGYGRIRYKNKDLLIHRLSFSIFNNLDLEGKIIEHNCNIRNCYNPDHLIIGTQSNNVKKSHENRAITYPTIKVNRKLKYYSNSELFSYIKSICNINNCWEYPTVKISGYSYITINKKSYRVHRLMYCLANNKKYENIDIIRHTCHNKRCCNPEHLLEGSNKDNSLDSREKSIATKLNKEKVIEILTFYENNKLKYKTLKEIYDIFSVKFTVSPACIKHVINGTRWVDVYKEFKNGFC